MSGLGHIERVIVPRTIADKSQHFLRAAGERRCEGMVLWAGEAEGTSFSVREPLIPAQRGIRTEDGVCVVVEGDELRFLNQLLFRSGLRLIAQVHSHPSEAYHSHTDDEFAVANTIGCFSLVVPDFAVRDFALEECAIYRLHPDGTWQELSPSRAAAIFDIRAG